MSTSAAARAPILILCRDRSGSTLLRFIMDSHSMVCCPPELNIGPLSERLKHFIEFSVAASLPKDAGAAAVPREIRKSIDSIMQTYAAAKGKQVWCEKSTTSMPSLDLLATVFPDARYLCLHRNSTDVVHSTLEASRYEWTPTVWEFVRGKRNFTQAILEHWADETEQQLAFEQAHPRTAFHIKYESIVAEPEPTLRALFAFLELPWEPHLLETVFEQSHDRGPGDSKIRFTKRIEKDTVGKGTRVPLQVFGEALIARVNSLHARLGYPPIGVATGPKQEVSAPTPAPAPTATIADVFERHIPEQLRVRATALADVRASFKFVITDVPGEVWVVDLSSSGSRVTRGDRPASCTLSLTSHALHAIVTQQMNGFTAFQEGAVQVIGDLDIASLVPRFL